MLVLFLISFSHATSLVDEISTKYANAEWDSFFGMSEYLLTLDPKSEDAHKVHALKSLALLKHCQWEKAAQAVDEMRPSSEKTELQSIVKVVLNSLKGEKWVYQPPPRKSIPIREWGIDQSELKKINPRRLMRKVKFLCKGSVP